MEKKWLEYEKLVAKVYKILNEDTDALVTHNDFIIGKVSGRKRQLDVTLKYNLPGLHLITIVVSCKNYNKKPNIKLIDEFSGLLEDIKVNKGVLICKSGFGNSILEYAKNRGIDLCTVEDIDKINPFEDLRIPFLHYKFDYDIKIHLIVHKDSINELNSNGFKLDLDSKNYSFDKFNMLSLSDYILEFWKINNLDEKSENFEKEILIDNIYYHNPYLVLIQRIKIIIKKSVKKKYQLFVPNEYYKLKHHTDSKEIRIITFNNEMYDFENPKWSYNKPKDFDNNLFYGNFITITSDEILDSMILNSFKLKP